MSMKKPKPSKVGTRLEWLVVDDNTGEVLKASNAVIDGEGTLTSREGYDEPELDYLQNKPREKPRNPGPFNGSKFKEELRPDVLPIIDYGTD